MSLKLTYDNNNINFYISLHGIALDKYILLTDPNINIGLVNTYGYKISGDCIRIATSTLNPQPTNAVIFFNNTPLSHIFTKGNIFPDIKFNLDNTSKGIILIKDDLFIHPETRNKDHMKHTPSPLNNISLLKKGIYLSSILRVISNNYKDKTINVIINSCLELDNNIYNRCVFGIMGDIPKNLINTIDTRYKLTLDNENTIYSFSLVDNKNHHIPNIHEPGEYDFIHNKAKCELYEFVLGNENSPYKYNQSLYKKFIDHFNNIPLSPNNVKNFLSSNDTYPYLVKIILLNNKTKQRYAYYIKVDELNDKDCEDEYNTMLLNGLWSIVGTKLTPKGTIVKPKNPAKDILNRPILQVNPILGSRSEVPITLDRLKRDGYNKIDYIVLYYFNPSWEIDKPLIFENKNILSKDNELYKINIFDIADNIYNNVFIHDNDLIKKIPSLDELYNLLMQIYDIDNDDTDRYRYCMNKNVPIIDTQLLFKDDNNYVCNPLVLLDSKLGCYITLIYRILNKNGTIKSKELKYLLLYYKTIIKADLTKPITKGKWYTNILKTIKNSKKEKLKEEMYKEQQEAIEIYKMLLMIRCLNSIKWDNNLYEAECSNIDKDYEKQIYMLKRINEDESIEGKIAALVSFGLVKNRYEKYY